MNCPNCGYPNQDDMKFCINCGAALKAPEVRQADQQNMQGADQQTDQQYAQQQYQQPAQPYQQYGQQQYQQSGQPYQPYGQQQYQQSGQPYQPYGQQQYQQSGQPYQPYGQQQYQQSGQPYQQYGQPYRQMPPPRPIIPPPPRKGISKNKTVFFWISKAVLVLAIISFFFPFMKMSPGKNYPSNAPGIFPNMTGKELIFGIEDEKQSEQDSLMNTYVQISGVLVVIALVMPQISHIFSGLSAGFLGIFIKYADHSYTYNKKPIYKIEDVIKLKFQPALYICIALLVIATIFAIIDEIKRRKLFDNEQKLLAAENGNFSQTQNSFSSTGGYI